MGGAVRGRLRNSFFWFGAVDWVLNIAPPTGVKCECLVYRGFTPAATDMPPPDWGLLCSWAGLGSVVGLGLR